MKDIIDHEKLEWKEEVVKDIFMPHDAAKVLKIRLPKDDYEDFFLGMMKNLGISQSRVLTN